MHDRGCVIVLACLAASGTGLLMLLIDDVTHGGSSKIRKFIGTLSSPIYRENASSIIKRKLLYLSR